MTKRDFILIATAMREAEPAQPEKHNRNPVCQCRECTQFVAWLAAITCLAHRLSLNNPRFDTPRFLAACSCGSGNPSDWKHS